MKTWAWILGLGGAFTAFAGWMASRAQASQFQTFTTAVPTRVGGFTVPAGVTLSANEQSVLMAIPPDPNQAGRVHPDLQQTFDMYIANRQPDGSVTINGRRFANLAAVMAAAMQGG